ncbi:hypothetical protein [Acinetobacter seifertii]|uniref:Uncharacterized protein n=1 Tax=Acinetobacter seifertii TaxID=1530123 RepID=N8SAM1_9GAMM|nr:hypothetical protein [Acinetobacter seifertii]ENU43417.1 hypothetical protein F985_02135 [Acinetobacter seifertii]OCZ52450.1 hypothetical protein A7P21_14245 [Acinetobacter seifertii]QXB46162.1 hypothetical protein I6L30_17420 [Acinetobacter seifertii]
MSQQTLLQELNARIEYYSTRTDYPLHRILVGYRAYAKLMLCSSFSDEVMNSALDPNKRKYKKLKIKVTKDDNQLDLE